VGAFEVWRRMGKLPVMTLEEYEVYERECSEVGEVPVPKMTPYGHSNIKRGLSERGERLDSGWEFTFLSYWRHVMGAVVERNELGYLLYVSVDGSIRKWFYDFVVNGELYEIKGQFRPDDYRKMDAHPEVNWITDVHIRSYERELNARVPGWRDNFIETVRGVPKMKNRN